LPALFPKDDFIQLEDINDRNSYFPILKKEIAAETTRKFRFYDPSRQWIDIRNEQFANWMVF
jgi:hypothetical protein